MDKDILEFHHEDHIFNEDYILEYKRKFLKFLEKRKEGCIVRIETPFGFKLIFKDKEDK